MLNGRKIVVVVPAFDEEAHIGDVVRSMPDFVDEIVLVDDGSEDETLERAISVDDERTHVVRHPSRRGVGAAIVSGYRHALDYTRDARDVVCVMAGDGQMDPADLRAIALPVAENRADYVKGDRFGNRNVRDEMGLGRWLGGQVFSRLTSAALRHRVSDSQCGYTAIARDALLALDLDDLWPTFGYPNDLLGQLAARGFRIADVPVRAVYGNQQSKLRLFHLPAIFYLVGRAAIRVRRQPEHVRVSESRAPDRQSPSHAAMHDRD